MNRDWSDPVLSRADARALEERLLAGDEALEWEAMTRVGAAIARAVLEDLREIGGFSPSGRILVLPGKGHNGGDALLAAAAILARSPGAGADVIFAGGARALRPLAARAWRDLEQGAPGRVAERSLRDGCPRACDRYELCLDGIFGFQFRPPVDAGVAALLDRVNAHAGIRLRAAVDLPSGVCEEPAAKVFRADFTYATGSVKAPVLEERNRAAVGRLRYLDLGFFAESGASRAAGRVLKPAVLAPLAALRDPQSDKRSFGHVVIVGGSRRYPGAVLMCVRAALRSGAGLVTAAVPESLVAAHSACAPEAIWIGLPETPDGGLALDGLGLLRERMEKATAVVIGPGLGAEPETLALAAELAGLGGAPLAIDADALRPEVLAAARGRPLICLPHAGEFRRIAGDAEGDSDTLQSFARENRAVVVLKGPVTRISDGRCVYHSLAGGPVLARGGSGDLLAGLVGGLLAQAPADALLAACRGVSWHGLAADLLARERGQVAVQVTQLLDHLPAALRAACDAG